ncbi:MAG: hypothetical protein WC860_09540, partial [Candidatus Margulisiibacteriota bacterium]
MIIKNNNSIHNSFQLSETVIYTFLSTLAVGIFVVASFFISFSMPLYILCLGVASIFIFKKAEVGLYTIIILTFIFGFSFGLLPIVWDDDVYKIYPIDILTIITGLSFLLSKFRHPEIKIKMGGRLGILILIFIIYCIFSLVYGVASGGEFNLAFSTLKNYALYAVFFFL